MVVQSSSGHLVYNTSINRLDLRVCAKIYIYVRHDLDFLDEVRTGISTNIIRRKGLFVCTD